MPQPDILPDVPTRLFTIVLMEPHWLEPIVQEVQSFRIEDFYRVLSYGPRGETYLTKESTMFIVHEDGAREKMRLYPAMSVFFLYHDKVL